MITDEQIVSEVEKHNVAGCTAKQLGEELGMSTATARRRMRRIASETGKLVDTGLVRIERGGTLDYVKASEMTKVPGASVVFAHRATLERER